MSRHAAAAGLLMSCAAGAGCFDVHATDPGPPVVDDFEDGDLAPAIRSFAGWTCDAFEPQAELACELTGGYASAFGLSTSFSIADAPDGVQRHGGVVIATGADRPVDLTPWSAITFDVRLTADKPAAPKALMHLDLNCSTVPSESGTAVVALGVVQSIAYSDGWSSIVLALSNFGPPPWQPQHIQGGAIACLRAVDQIAFVFDAALPDGDSTTGVFSIDDVRLQ